MNTLLMCSTPYGIRGLDQLDQLLDALDCVGFLVVLNALRHQRVGSGLSRGRG